MTDAPIRPRLYARPLPVAATVLLAVNDHLLKGTGLVPGWLTGKLSDFAGLFFAPLLLAELTLVLVPARCPEGVFRRALACAALVAAGFSAVKLSAAGNALYLFALETLTAPLGWSFASVRDPTDLLALPMCALAVSYARRAVRP